MERTDGASVTDLSLVALDSTDAENVRYYSLNDTLASGGVYKYRLVQVDLSSAEHPFLWHTVGVQTEWFTDVMQGISQESALSRILASGNYTFQLMDLQGRTVIRKLVTGENYENLLKDCSLQTGIYILELTSNKDSYVRKILME